MFRFTDPPTILAQKIKKKKSSNFSPVIQHYGKKNTLRSNGTSNRFQTDLECSHQTFTQNPEFVYYLNIQYLKNYWTIPVL